MVEPCLTVSRLFPRSQKRPEESPSTVPVPITKIQIKDPKMQFTQATNVKQLKQSQQVSLMTLLTKSLLCLCASSILSSSTKPISSNISSFLRHLDDILYVFIEEPFGRTKLI